MCNQYCCIFRCSDVWQWSELSCCGEICLDNLLHLSVIGGNKIIVQDLFDTYSGIIRCPLFRHDGWDGKEYLSDAYIMDTSEPANPDIQAVHTIEFILLNMFES